MKKKDKAACQALAICAADLENILEDVYVEAKMCDAFPGTFRQGIRLNNFRMTEQLPDLSDQLAEGYAPLLLSATYCCHIAESGKFPTMRNFPTNIQRLWTTVKNTLILQ